MARPDGLSHESPEAFMGEIRAFTRELVAAVARASPTGLSATGAGRPGRGPERGTRREGTRNKERPASTRKRSGTAPSARAPNPSAPSGLAAAEAAANPDGPRRAESPRPRTRTPRQAPGPDGRRAPHPVRPDATPTPTMTQAEGPGHPHELSPRPPCPRCGAGRVMAGRQAWGCTRWREGCRFVVAFVQASQPLPREEADRLFRKGETRLMAGLTPKGRARLVLDPEAEGGVRVAPYVRTTAPQTQADRSAPARSAPAGRGRARPRRPAARD
jgi:DNA topoisomerase-3